MASKQLEQSGVRVWSCINQNLFCALAVVTAWLSLRANLGRDPTPLSVLLEWILLGVVTFVVSSLQFELGSRWRWLFAFGSLVMIGFAIRTVTPFVNYPNYWAGFGSVVLIASLLLALLTVIVVEIRPLRPLLKWCSHRLQRPVAILMTIWAVPSIIQPMDGWLNLGDSTEKVLDEIAGWVNGKIPGVHTSWAHTSLLGMLVWPLSLLPIRGDWKIVAIVLYVNLLMLAIPLLMGLIIRRAIPKIDSWLAFAIGLTAVSLSGSPGNASLFQELSSLARGFFPVVLGLAVILVAKQSRAARPAALISVGGLSAIAFLNNLEYGAGAALAAFVVVGMSHDLRPEVFRRLVHMGLGFVVVVALASLSGFLMGGDWVGRRLGAWYDVVGGQGRQHSNNAGSMIPAFSLPAIYFAISIAAVASTFRATLPTSTELNGARVSALYFGLWSLLSAPYFLNGGGSGSFRSQFLMIPVVLIIASLLGVASSNKTSTIAQENEEVVKRVWLSCVKRSLVRAPLAVLATMCIVAVVQTPNGVKEWRRVQMPSTMERKFDEWSPQTLDWIDVGAINDLAARYGGSTNVGWWFSYGNAVEILTGVENLLGVTGRETMRSVSQLRLGCEPLLKSSKKFVISHESELTRMNDCEGLRVTALTMPNDDGLVVFAISRND